MDNNILYVGVNMLDMLEAVKDNSKDFILLFMPPNMGGTVGDTALRPVIDKETCEKWYHKSKDFHWQRNGREPSTEHFQSIVISVLQRRLISFFGRRVVTRANRKRKG